MAVDIKDVEQVAQELQQKFDDFKAKNDKRVEKMSNRSRRSCSRSLTTSKQRTTSAWRRLSRKKANLPGRWKP
ncbi:hypothetical protein O5559_12770 [Escherichia coli]|nr:hypothetical protein [Escherichia coli]